MKYTSVFSDYKSFNDYKNVVIYEMKDACSRYTEHVICFRHLFHKTVFDQIKEAESP